MVELGKLHRLDARDAWSHEARDFTPWLREHISQLGEALGLDLDLVEAEVPVGPFAADLVAKDVSNDRWVVIENQLEPTDHSHLGQLLTYGAGTEAGVFVWISPEFRDEHRAALDWLNEHTDEGSLFFGVVLELLAVDDSRPAPNFRLVSFPNEWRKERVRTKGPATGKGAAYEEFFGALLGSFKSSFPRETNVSKAQPQSWLSMGFGKSGLTTGWAFTFDKRFRTELYIDTGDLDRNDSYFQQFDNGRGEIEDRIGHELDWDTLEGKRGCRISSYYQQVPVSVLDDGPVLERLREWGQAEMKKLRDAFRPLVDKLRDE